MKRARHKRLKKLAAVAAVVVFALCALFLWASGGVQKPKTFDGPISDYAPDAAEPPRVSGSIVLLTWNISYAYGAGSEGEGYAPRSADELARRLDRIGAVIRDSGADVVFLQEVDFNSARSARVDQLRELARVTGLRYAARAVTWKAGYVPFPYWPPRSHFGAMCSGTAVLSRLPITANRVTLHPKPSSNSWLRNAFYTFRSTEVAEIQCGGRTLLAVNSHLEAWDKANRAAQAGALAATVEKLAASGCMLAFGGDLNTVPPEAAVKTGFPDAPDDYQNDTTLSILRNVSGIKDVIDESAYRQSESPYFTFPAAAPNRRLDYLFVSKEAAVADARVIQAGDLSDHLPLRAQITLTP